MILHFRRAEPGDCQLYFQWANDPLVRSFSYSKEAIDFKTHTEWYHRKISDPNVMMLLFLDGNKVPVGQVRFHESSDRSFAVINVSVSPDFRGQGLGKRIIRDATQYYFAQQRYSRVRAMIFESNTASRQSFTHAGFHSVGKEPVQGIASITMEISANVEN